MVLTTVDIGSWSISFDWNLRATINGKTSLPFRHHIDPRQHSTTPSSNNLHGFSHLPTELQQHIVSFCDPATLFQFMHVSFRTRLKAKELFWSDPTTRYVIDGQWLLAGGHPRHINYELEALTHMQYIEVGFICYSSGFLQEWMGGGYHSYSDIIEGEKQRTSFWNALRRRFPRVTDVVLTAPGRDIRNCRTSVPEKVARLATGAPEGISVSISQIKWQNSERNPIARYLWRRNPNNTHRPSLAPYSLISTSWNPTRIIPPTRTYSGPVGAYQRHDHHRMDLVQLEFAREFHAVNAIKTYFSHLPQAPYICPFPGCGEQFKQLSDWVTHYPISCFPRSDEDCPRLPPPPCEALRIAFERHDALLDVKYQRLADEMTKMRDAWGEPDSLERRTVSRQFLEQLRDDPLYAGVKEPEESEIWFMYQRDMNKEKHPEVY